MGDAARRFERQNKPPEKKRVEQGADGRRLWEEPTKEDESKGGGWMDVQELVRDSVFSEEGRANSEVYAYDQETGDAIVGRESGGERPRLRLIQGELSKAEARAREELDRLATHFDASLDALMRVGGREDDLSKDQVMQLKDVLIAEAAKAEDPQKELLNLLKDVTRFETRAADTTLTQLMRRERELGEQLTQASQQDRQGTMNELQAVKRQMYKLRRELHPSATREQLYAIADDIGAHVDIVNWRPYEEQGLGEIQGRIAELEGQMKKINAKGDFDPVAELKWYALRDELRQYRLMEKAADLRERKSHMYATDFEGQLPESGKNMPWDMKLESIGKTLEVVPWDVRNTSVFRMLEDLYRDEGMREKATSLAQSLIRSKTATEHLRDAAKALREDVREGRLPRPEHLVQKAKEARAERLQKRKERSEAAKKKREEQRAKKKSEWTKVDQAMLGSWDKTRGRREMAADIEIELGLEDGDIVKLKETFDTVMYRFKQYPSLRDLGPGFNWSEFINAPPNGESNQSKLKSGWHRLRSKIGMSPRKRMLRKLRRSVKNLPSSARENVQSRLNSMKVNILEV